jgi:uncharacterized membrane protein
MEAPLYQQISTVWFDVSAIGIFGPTVFTHIAISEHYFEII